VVVVEAEEVEEEEQAKSRINKLRRRGEEKRGRPCALLRRIIDIKEGGHGALLSDIDTPVDAKSPAPNQDAPPQPAP
jgi:hypothetical protein